MSMTLSRLAALAVIALALAGCQTAAEMRAADENKCASYGFRSGTDAFAECLQRIDLDRRADLRRSSREGLSLVQPRYVVVHHHRR